MMKTAKRVQSKVERKIKYNMPEKNEGFAGEGTKERQIYWSGKTNELTKQFIQNRYVVLKNFVPKRITDMALDTWKSIESNKEWHDMFFPEPEVEITFNSPKSSLQKSEGCYCFPPAISLHRWLKQELDGVIDLHLAETYSYTRKYERGAYLKSHTDRPSCEVSITLCLDYKTDDNKPWKIWLDNSRNFIDDPDPHQIFEETQNVPVRKRTGKSIELEVGDVLLYQGPNIPHWRDYLLGDYSYHMFMHFINLRSKLNYMKDAIVDEKNIRKHILEFDGRKDRYTIDNKNPAMEDWVNNIYLPEKNKSQFVNNFDDFTIEDE